MEKQQEVFTFAGGPTMSPKIVKQKLRQKMFPSQGSSYLQINSNTQQYQQVLQKAKQNLRVLLNIPHGHQIWYCGAGCHLQFAGLPMNFINGIVIVYIGGSGANYTTTGYFSKLSFTQAQRYTNAHSIVDMQKNQYGKFTLPESYDYLPNASYTHFIDNQTVQGLQYPQHKYPYIPGIPLIDDCSSSFMTKPINWDQVTIAYAHAQKNCGISGCTIIIADPKCLNTNKMSITPYICDYRNYQKNHTFPQPMSILPIYANLTMTQYLIQHFGTSSERYSKRAQKLYNVLDKWKIYNPLTVKQYRSRINVTWTIQDKQLQKKCLDEGAKQGLYQFKGHRTTGGFRASLFAPVPDQGVSKLTDYLQQFAHQHS